VLVHVVGCIHGRLGIAGPGTRIMAQIRAESAAPGDRDVWTRLASVAMIERVGWPVERGP